MQDLSSARYISLASLIALTLTLLIVVVELPFYVKEYYATLFPKEARIIAACPSFSFFSGAGIVFFAFTNQAQLLPIYNELDMPVKRRIMKVTKLSNFIVTFFYLLMALFGYFSTLGRTPVIILLRETLPQFNPDYFMILASFLVMIVMIVNCVTNYLPFRSALFTLIYDHDDISKRQNIIITAVFYVAVIIISILFPNVNSVLGIFGGLTSTSICYAIPCKEFP